ncbi:hypothetical protein OOU_Y34scaffold00283g75 [Pyricularia oryzae Y34]|uniref:Uncharacterized protein n=3 Tax=Pyricularia oryzae TaxID=318829 RepID=A0A4P7N3J9_PYROR|nr:hypothetical protein OOU_Y34scaffold00283g75 [Pyricularia oryzae Y34]QBZ54484.1 hypothetical protein PoMZ_10184 [Pyricularia oryzae]
MNVPASALPGQAVWVMDVLDCLLRKADMAHCGNIG